MVENDSLHTNLKRPRGDCAAVQHGLMADGDVFFNIQGSVRVNVQHAAFLNVGVLAHADARVVSADAAIAPDAGTRLDDDIADDVGPSQR